MTLEEQGNDFSPRSVSNTKVCAFLLFPEGVNGPHHVGDCSLYNFVDNVVRTGFWKMSILCSVLETLMRLWIHGKER